MRTLLVCMALMALALAGIPNKLENNNRDDGFTVNPLKKEKPVEENGFTVVPLRDESNIYVSIEEFRKYLESDRIVGGATESPLHSYPWQVLVYWAGSLCGGTLISPKLVLTAAHCIPAYTSAPSIIVAGASTWCTMASNGTLYWNLESSQQVRTVAKVYRMGGNLAYRYAGMLFDIAILEVNIPYTLNSNVAVAKLPTARTPVGTSVTVSGWGYTSEGGKISCTLQQVMIPVVNKTECNIYYNNTIRSSQICAGLKTGGVDACQGDSGGPLVVERSSTDATVVGIVSFGFGCARPNYYGVYTDVYTFLPWIKTILTGGTWTSCPDQRTWWIGDNYCDNEMNSAACLYDAGDCCGNTTPGWNLYCRGNCTCMQP